MLNNIAMYIAVVAKGYGSFGSWFRIFKNEPEVIQALLDNNIIPVTSQNCFDPTTGFSFVNRNPTNLTEPI